MIAWIVALMMACGKHQAVGSQPPRRTPTVADHPRFAPPILPPG